LRVARKRPANRPEAGNGDANTSQRVIQAPHSHCRLSAVYKRWSLEVLLRPAKGGIGTAPGGGFGAGSSSSATDEAWQN
jgi:hypothetical protein